MMGFGIITMFDFRVKYSTPITALDAYEYKHVGRQTIFKKMKENENIDKV